MLAAVRYTFDGEILEHHFARGSARLSIYDAKTQQLDLLRWGRRPKEPGVLPFGSSARRNNILGGRWDAWQPRSVRQSVSQFMMLDVAQRSHWFEVTPGMWLHGVVASAGNEQRVYVITLEGASDEIEFECWPKMLAFPE